MSKKQETSKARRNFFRTAGLGIGAMGAAVVGLRAGDGEAAVERRDSGKKTRAGYQETAHVKKYYELARF